MGHKQGFQLKISRLTARRVVPYTTSRKARGKLDEVALGKKANLT